MSCRYTLDWLDSLINDTLQAPVITPEQIQSIKTKIEEEKLKHQLFLNQEVFRLLEEEKIRVFINQYYSTLTLLLDQSWHNKTNNLYKNPLFKQVRLTLIKSIEELITFMEVRFSNNLNLDQRAPITHLLIVKKNIKIFLATIKPQLVNKLQDRILTGIIETTLLSFLMDIDNGVPVVLRDVFYTQELMERIKELALRDPTSCNSASLNNLLFYLNFNCPDYIHYYTNAISEKIATYPSISDRLDLLLILRKEFNQKQSKSGVALRMKEQDVKSLIGNWFDQEIHYLEDKNRLSVMAHQGKRVESEKKPEELPKVSCALSVDQLSLILRAAAELLIIKGHSLTIIFKQIVPHLSTPTKADISWDSMRSKSYAAEKRDKEIVIQKLEQMIKKVKEY